MARHSKGDLPRVRHLRNLHAEQLQQLAEAQSARSRVLRRPQGAFELALAIDPTPKALYLQTILRWLVAGTMRLEDARIVRDTLARFHAEKRRLPLRERDIGSHAGPGDVAETMSVLGDPIVEAIPSEIREACPLVARGDGWSIFQVEDTASATWWADSTTWCTRHPTTAMGYLSKGPLHVITTGTGKYQMHGPSSQLMDRYDRRVESMPDVPDEGLRAMHDLLTNGRSGFRPVGLETWMEAELVKRGDTTAWASWPIEQAKHNPASWIACDSSVVLSPKSDGTVEAVHVGLDGSTLRETVTAATLVRDIELDSLVFDFMRSGIVNACASGDAIVPLTADNEILRMLIWLKIGPRQPVVVKRDGRGVGMWAGWQSPKPPFDDRNFVMEVFDPEAAPGDRIKRFRSRDDLKAAPHWMRDAVRMIAEEQHNLVATALVGFDDLGDAATAKWRSREGRDHLMHMLTLYSPPIDFIRDSVAMAFPEPEEAAAMARLISATRTDGMLVRPRPTPTPPSAEDLLTMGWLDGVGVLMAGLPDEDCTDHVVDRLLGMGRTETLNVVPAKMVTKDRVASVYQSRAPHTSDHIFSRRVVSVEAYRTIKDTERLLGPRDQSSKLSKYLKKYIDDKGASIVRSLSHRFEDRTNRYGINQAARLVRDVDGAPDRACRELMQDPIGRKMLEKEFDGIPLVGLPWPLVLEGLVSSDEGLDDVLSSLMKSGWSSSGTLEERVADLCRARPDIKIYASEHAGLLATRMPPVESIDLRATPRPATFG